MSFITAQLRRSDAQLSRFQLLSKSSLIASSNHTIKQEEYTSRHGTNRTDQLEAAIRLVSSASADGRILHPGRLWAVLEQAGLGSTTGTQPQEQDVAATAIREYNQELEWILVSKAAAQVQGWMLKLFLDEIAPVMDDIYYWDGVLGSWRYSALYMVQRVPEKFWHTSKAVISEAKGRLQQLQIEDAGAVSTLTTQWQKFYGLVREQIRERSVADFQSRLVSPVNMARLDASARLKGLHKQKEMCAAAIGILANESLVFKIDPTPSDDDQEVSSVENWKDTVAQSVKLMSSVLLSVTNHNVGTHEYEDSVFLVARREAPSTDDVKNISLVLAQMLADTLPEHVVEYRKNRRAFGRPSRIVRYWIPALVLALSSSTLLRILVSRRAAIVTWIQELGQTSIDFWHNWVVDPIKRLIGTIRHEESSEIALMSRESLEGDRASLERMVVDFAIDNPETAGGKVTDAQIDLIRSKVKEGDLSTVLRAYEHDLKSPLRQAVMGNLIRELLIQIQKTKVDVEVAMAGIDALLKSQELVFGFVSLTPGLLVCVALGRWLSGVFGGRKGRARGKQQTRMIRVLRNIDLILTNAAPQGDNQILTYADHGLVLCEIQDLQANGEKIFPGEIYREFMEDLRFLMDIHQGIHRQAKVVERLRWAYWKWLK